MHPRLVECIRGARGWLVPAALLAVAPKCVLCLAAYAGIGAALGLGGPDLCGVTESTHWTPLVLGALGAGGFLFHRIIQGPRSRRP